VLFIALLVFTSPEQTSAPEPSGEGTSTADAGGVVSSTTNDQTTTAAKPMAANPATGGGTSGAGAPPPSTPQVATSYEVGVTYPDVYYSLPYVVTWRASAGTKATIALVKGGEKVAAIGSCTDMTVVAGKTQYCMWQQEPLGAYLGTSGYTLKLTVRDSRNTVVGNAASSQISFVRNSALVLVPFKNNSFGWSVRYPEGWKIATAGAKTVIAKDAAELTNPATSYEAFIVEYCSTVRETCARRVEEYKLAGDSESTLGNKRSLTHTVLGASSYTRIDLLEHDGMAFFVSRRALDASGRVWSPFVRASLSTFAYETARTTADSYTLDESFRAGGLLIEYSDEQPSYIRLYTAARNCSSEITSGSFTIVDSQHFEFTKNACTIKGHLQSDRSYEVTEDGCESLHTNECAFKGTYLPALF